MDDLDFQRLLNVVRIHGEGILNLQHNIVDLTAMITEMTDILKKQQDRINILEAQALYRGVE